MNQEESVPTALEVEIATTYYAQDISETINRRIGTLLICIQFLLGSSAMAHTLPITLIGFLVAAISAIQCAYKFSDKSAKNRECKMKYSPLMNEAELSRSDHDLYIQVKKKHSELEVDEPQVSQAVLHLAELCARKRLYLRPAPMQLTILQKTIALFAGIPLLSC